MFAGGRDSSVSTATVGRGGTGRYYAGSNSDAVIFQSPLEDVQISQRTAEAT